MSVSEGTCFLKEGAQPAEPLLPASLYTCFSKFPTLCKSCSFSPNHFQSTHSPLGIALCPLHFVPTSVFLLRHLTSGSSSPALRSYLVPHTLIMHPALLGTSPSFPYIMSFLNHLKAPPTVPCNCLLQLGGPLQPAPTIKPTNTQERQPQEGC